MAVTGKRVTVLMSVYNDQGYLGEAVQSILSQTFRDFEFLIIDDGSTKPIESLLEAYPDNRIVCIRQSNMGLTRSLNRGLSLATGEYIARMDADDVSLPQRLKAQVMALDADPTLDMVGAFFDVVDQDGTVMDRKELITDPIYRLWRLQFHNNYGHGTMMLRKKSVMAAGMYDESLSYAQDYDLWCRLSTATNTAIIPDVLYRYRMVKSSSQASVRNYDAQLATAVRISDRNLKACNPLLSEHQCIEVRALYWKFQRPAVSRSGLEALPATLEGFCRRFRIEGHKQRRLRELVFRDAWQELQESAEICGHDKTVLGPFLEKLLGGYTDVRLFL
jgi:glycosyltransferase involved in cell wall biosynthesis